MNKLILDEAIAQDLAQARKVYGNNNQILVSIEELNELACVLAKYPRYADEAKATQELYSKVLDEVADVMVILNHVQHIFHMTDTDINERIIAKTNRLKRWLHNSDSMEETVRDRKVEETIEPTSYPCKTCQRNIAPEKDYCVMCHQAQATEGIAPFYKSK